MQVQERRRVLIESESKGIFLALSMTSVFHTATVGDAFLFGGCLFGALVAGLVVTQWTARRGTGTKPAAWFARAVVAVLDAPSVVHGALHAGVVVYLAWRQVSWKFLLVATAAGALLGAAFSLLMTLRRRQVRLAIAGSILVGLLAANGALEQQGMIFWAGEGPAAALALGFVVLAFYVMLFAGRAEETETEIGLACAGIALALVQLQLPPLARGVVVIAPLGLYVLYCERIRRHLIAFKHIVRGMSYEGEHLPKPAILAYQAALRIDPESDIAQAGLWRIHRRLDTSALAQDEALRALVDPGVCLERARHLLDAGDGRRLDEVHKLLDLVLARRPDQPRGVAVERIKAWLAAGDPTSAIAHLAPLVRLLPSEVAALPESELRAHFELWRQAMKHPMLQGAGSLDLLEDAVGLFGFLSTVERWLAVSKDDADAAAFKPFLYDKVRLATYERFVAQHADESMDWFDHASCVRQATDRTHPPPKERAIELLRIAELGLPQQRLRLWSELARLHETDAPTEALQWHERVKDLALERGLPNLEPDERDAFYRGVKALADAAERAGDLPVAVENLQYYAQSPAAGLTTLDRLRQLYEDLGEPELALLPVEAALAFSLGENERRKWTAHKARLYQSIPLDRIRQRLDRVGKVLDYGYCYRRALRLYEQDADPDAISRFLDLASLGGVEHLRGVNLLLGRMLWHQGKKQDAALCLEAARANRPAKFRSSEEEELYFTACRLLGELYLEELQQPEKAIEPLLVYKDYVKSGAETLFKLAKAYEASRQLKHARKWYDMVLVYPGHPRAEQARQALERLAASASGSA